MLPAMSCAVFNAQAFVCNVLVPLVLFLFVGRNGWKSAHALLPHAAEDEIACSDDESSDSEELKYSTPRVLRVALWLLPSLFYL